MECLNCKEEVSQKFAFCIAQNACPFCGQNIMEPALQEVLNKLREVMTDIGEKGFLEEAEGWLQSNLDLISTKSNEYKQLVSDLTETKNDIILAQKEIEELKNKHLPPVPRSGKGLTPPGVQIGVDENGNAVQMQGDQIQDASRTNVFFQRAQANKNVNNASKLKEYANQVKNGGLQASNGGVDPLWAAMNDPSVDTDIAQYYPQANSPYDGEEPLPSIVEQFAMTGNQSSTYNAKDVAALQKLHAKSQGLSSELDFGGSVGSVKRM